MLVLTDVYILLSLGNLGSDPKVPFVGWVLAKAALVDHQFLEGVEIRGNERADRFIIIREDLLPSSL